jgi:arsenate reductase (thioredoxin)
VTRDPQIDAQLRHVVDSLVNHTAGAFPREQLTALVDELYEEMSASASVQTFVPVMVGRAALARLGQDQAEATAALAGMPEVLIVCQDNVGRSQAAAALLRHYAPGRLNIVSAGVAPKGHVLEEVSNSLAARGLLLTDPPAELTDDFLAAAQHLVVIGQLQEQVPDMDGLDRHDWTDIPHIEGLSADEIDEVLEDLDVRVRELLGQWLPDVTIAEAVMSTTSEAV